MPIRTIEWKGELPGKAVIVEQTLLPQELKYVELTSAEDMWQAIRRLAVRGAPAIGIAAAYGLVLGIQNHQGSTASLLAEVERVAKHLATSRPTAVNLFWALDRMQRRARELAGRAPDDAKRALLAEAHAILEEDRDICRRLGEHGARLIQNGQTALTHCNAGGLATSEYGTALAVLFSAAAEGKAIRVFADETRPLLQGARLTAWELQHAGLDVTLICDSMAGQVMRERKIDMVFVGADRIAANGDTANKIGTYSVSVLAKAHGVPFYVVAPSCTFDLSIPDGSHIPIEERAAEEITQLAGHQTAPAGVKV